MGMKILFFKHAAVVLACMLLVSCFEATSRYMAVPPRPPQSWLMLLGEPHWCIEWLDSSGQKQMADILPGQSIEIEVPAAWANPVSARPFWPEKNLPVGFFRPAGAIFPFDVSGGIIKLSWEAGPEAVFYMELAHANKENNAKIPANFDWPRFRSLLKGETINQAVREDPWLVDWRYVAEKTISANFDQRRLVPESAESLSIAVSPGPWYGTSPFSKPLYFVEGETPIFKVRPGINLWFSEQGILRVNGKTWVLVPGTFYAKINK